MFRPTASDAPSRCALKSQRVWTRPSYCGLLPEFYAMPAHRPARNRLTQDRRRAPANHGRRIRVHPIDELMENDDGEYKSRFDFLAEGSHEAGDHTRIDPLAPSRTADFDWEGLEARLDEAATLPDAERERLVEVFTSLISWAVSCSNPKAIKLEQVGKRVIALAWTLSPSYFEGMPSCRELAKRAGIHKDSLSDCTAKASRKFGIKNRAQSHGWNAKKPESDSANADVSRNVEQRPRPDADKA